MAISVWPRGDSGFFAALAAHTALALEADIVVIARLAGPSRERLQTVAITIDGQLAENTDCPWRNVFPEEAITGNLWLCTDVRRYDALHAALQDVLVQASLVLSLRDSAGAPIGLIGALKRQPLTQIDAAAATLRVFGARAAAELERASAIEDNRRLVTYLDMRVRELTLLHDVARVLQRDEPISAADWLNEIAHAITRSWPHSTAVGVQARLGEFEVATHGAGDLPVMHRADFVFADGRTGGIEVRCCEDDSSAAEEPARSALLGNVAEMFRIAVDRHLVLSALRQSEQRYRSVVEHQSDLVCRYLPDTTLTFVNDAYCRFFGKRRDELLGRRFIELIPEADRATALQYVESLVRSRKSQRYEHAVLMADGSVGHQLWIDHVITSADDTAEELQGIGRDITDRWRAEEALRQKEASLREAYERFRSLAHRLILAQEAERKEIAHDLHDEVSQQVAALGIGLSLVETRLSDQPNAQREVARLREMTSGLAETVRHVSHTLHPGVLKHAGLSAAIASHCEAVAAQYPFDVQFDARGIFSDVDGDIALCLYRAVQQALRNVAMHASASRSWVSLKRLGNRVELTITDNGRGFDTSTARSRGLGLLSIEERVHLANGTFLVTSRLGGGSRMTVQVPVGWS